MVRRSVFSGPLFNQPVGLHGKRSAGRMIGVYGLGALAGSYLGGWLSDRIGVIWVMVFSLILSAIGYVVLCYMVDPLNIIVALFIVAVVTEAFRLANEVIEKVKSGYKYTFIYKTALLLQGNFFQYTTECTNLVFRQPQQYRPHFGLLAGNSSAGFCA